MGKPPQWVEHLLADQLSDQSTTVSRESEIVSTNDLVDEDARFTESDHSDTDRDEQNDTDSENHHTEDSGTVTYVSSSCAPTTTPYNFRRNPKSSFKVMTGVSS